MVRQGEARHPMTSPKALATALALNLTLAGFAVAQNVPLPTPAPRNQATQPPRPSAPIPLTPGAVPTPQTDIARAPAIRPPAHFRPGETTPIAPRQRAPVDKVSAYLTSLRTLTGDFVQVGPDGKKSEGEFYLQKPGKVRFDYNPPNPTELIADGSSVVVRDRKLATQDLYPLSQTPLRFLLADRIDLARDTNLTQVYADDLFVTVVVEEKTVLVGTSKLMMMFGAKDFQLKQWVVTDPQGYDTTIAVSNIDIASRPDPSLFKIDYTQYPN